MQWNHLESNLSIRHTSPREGGYTADFQTVRLRFNVFIQAHVLLRLAYRLGTYPPGLAVLISRIVQLVCDQLYIRE